MVRNFRGQVRISDVQEEFDNLVDGINNMITSYNNAVDTTETVDYTKGGTTLAPIGYTLTIGGLKQVLKLYDGAVLGSEVYKIADKNFYVANGLYIKDGKVIRLNQGLVQGEGDILYYDLTHNAYTFGDKYVTSSTGGATVITKPWVQPILTSNTSWGSITDDVKLPANAWDGADKGQTYALFNNSTAISYLIGYKDTHNNDITWNFQTPLKLTNVSLQAMGFSTYSLDDKDYVSASLQILDVTSGAVLAERELNNQLTTFDIPISLTDAINGVTIRIRFTGNRALRNMAIGKIKLTADSIQEVSIPDTETGNVDKNNLIKVADLNTNRIVKLCNTPNFTAENITGFKFGAKGVDINDGTNMPLQNTNKGQFLSVFRRTLYNNRQYAKLFGENITGGVHTDDNVGCYFGPVTRMFIPKGLPNPFTNQIWQMVTDYIVKREPFKQK